MLTPEMLLAQREFYTPKSLLMPLHDQRNQLHVSAGMGGGYDLNLSYAFTDKFAIFHTATFAHGSKKRISLLGDRYNVEKNDYVLKGGLGYFSKPDDGLFSMVETYVGAGVSKIDNYWYFAGDSDGEFTQASYWSVFGQFNAGNKAGRSEVAFGVRLAYSQYMDFDFYGNHPNTSSMKSSFENLSGFSLDPVASYSHKLKGFKLNAQVGWAIPVSFGSVTKSTLHTSDIGATVVTSEENVHLGSFLGRLSVQYNLNLGKDR